MIFSALETTIFISAITKYIWKLKVRFNIATLSLRIMLDCMKKLSFTCEIVLAITEFLAHSDSHCLSRIPN